MLADDLPEISRVFSKWTMTSGTVFVSSVSGIYGKQVHGELLSSHEDARLKVRIKSGQDQTLVLKKSFPTRFLRIQVSNSESE